MSKNQYILFLFSITFLITLLMTYFRPEIFDKYFMKLFLRETKQTFVIKGIGIIGDSLSDEYQADDARGYEYAPTTLNWVEQLVKNRRINFGVWNQWGDARRTGFQYNWSRSGATISDAIANGQHTGLAQYVANGEINAVIIYIGGNDFSPFNTKDGYLPIYNGVLSERELREKIEDIVENITLMLDTIQKIRLNNGKLADSKIVLVTVPDWNLSPVIEVANRNDEGRERVSNAIASVNRKLVEIADKRKITLLDINDYYRKLVSNAILGSTKVGSENISLYIPGDNPERAFLSDTIHPGTVLNGLFANYLLEGLNKSFGTNIVPLTSDEILKNAGLRI